MEENSGEKVFFMTGRDDRLEEYEQKIAQGIEKYPSYVKILICT